MNIKEHVEIPDIEESFKKWKENYKTKHPIAHFIDNLLPSGIFDYSAGYALTHPWVILREIFLQAKWAWQRVFRGWDDRVVWSIDFYLARMIPVWLKALQEEQSGVSAIFFGDKDLETNPISREAIEKARNERDKIYFDIIRGFESYKKMNDIFDVKSAEYIKLKKDFEKGFDLLKKYWKTLWD